MFSIFIIIIVIYVTNTSQNPTYLSIKSKNGTQTNAIIEYILTNNLAESNQLFELPLNDSKNEIIETDMFKLAYFGYILNNRSISIKINEKNKSLRQKNQFELSNLIPNSSYDFYLNLTFKHKNESLFNLKSNNINIKTLSFKCPCDLSRSNGECEFFNNTANLYRCVKCLSPYKGDLCLDCDTRSFKNSDNLCLMCNCNDNVDVNDGNKLCLDFTGECLNCKFNTTGKYCDKCLAGYSGNPFNKSCVLISDTTTKAYTAPYSYSSYNPNMKKESKNFFIFTLLIFVVLTFLVTFSYYYYNIRLKSTNNLNNIKCSQIFNNLRTRIQNYNSNRRANQFLRAQFDDDRLNLAENQILDDDDFYFLNQSSNTTHPYRTLTVSNN